MNYTHAIVREPCDNLIYAVSSSGLGSPDVKLAKKQHKNYCSIIESIGVKLIKLKKDNNYPDSVFIEDTAIKVGDTFVVGRFGVESRLGEEKEVVSLLGNNFNLEFIDPPGTLEGGDVLCVGTHYYIGLSDRSNHHGIRQFSSILDKMGYSYTIVPVVNLLHLKTGASCINGRIMISVSKLSKWFIDPIEVNCEEAYAANILYVNGKVVIPNGYPVITEKIEKAGWKVIKVDISEFRKIDGSLTCMSILF